MRHCGFVPATAPRVALHGVPARKYTSCSCQNPLVTRPAAAGSKVRLPNWQAVFAYGTPSSNERELKKKSLLQRLKPARLGRAVGSDATKRREYDEMVQEMERLNPCPVPVESPNISGKWRLVYTDSAAILGTKRPPIARPNDDIFQTIDAPQNRVLNEETTILFGLIPLKVDVRASFVASSPSRIDVKFEEFGVLKLFKFKAGDRFRGWLDTTYLDETMRISRSNKGNVFVLVKD